MSPVGPPVPAPLSSFFLPAERSSPEEIQRQLNVFTGHPLAETLLDAGLGFAMVLNRHRQVVHLNQSFRQYLRDHGGALEAGQRPGELLHCAQADKNAGGCGTSEACQCCGAAHSIAAGLSGRTHVAECRIQTEQSGDDLTLMVRGTPLELAGERFVILSAMDISHEKRRRALERVFFHDILNTAGSINGLAELIRVDPGEEVARTYAPLMVAASHALLDDIAAQRDLAAAESDELLVRPTVFRTDPLLRELSTLCSAHVVGQGRFVEMTDDSEDLLIMTDRALLMRVLANLLKNALEAEPRGSTVSIRSLRQGRRAVFEVHNPSAMSRGVQLQVFQRSFSTKGKERGLGTYSIRLLSERYLGGSVSFTSTPQDGTLFRVEYPLGVEP